MYRITYTEPHGTFRRGTTRKTLHSATVLEDALRRVNATNIVVEKMPATDYFVTDEMRATANDLQYALRYAIVATDELFTPDPY